MPQSPPTVRVAAVVQAAESVVVLAATVLAGVDAARGQSYHVNSGIALTAIGVGAAAVLAWIAVGLARARHWSRTPALLTQLFVGIVGIYLLQGHRLDWGLVSVLLAAAGFAALLSPRSLRALTGETLQQPPGQQAASGPQEPAGSQQEPAGGQQAREGGRGGGRGKRAGR
jgi:hypothetical protein